jgi:hypothetical protein
MVRAAGATVLFCLLFAAPAAARVAPPQCPPETRLWTPANTPLNLPAPNCVDGAPPFALALVSPPQHGAVTGNDPYVYTPSGGFRGEDQFQYTITNANGTSQPATVRILVNTLPTCNDGSATVVANQRLVLNDFDCDDADGDAISIFVGQPQHGTITFPPDGTVVYTPIPGYVGTDSFDYYAGEDDQTFGLDSDDATMHITVTSPAPIVTPTPPQVVRPPVAAPKPADLTAPVIALRNASRKQAVSIALTTNENVTVTLTLKLDTATAKRLKLSRTVGQIKTALRPGTSNVAVQLSAKARKAFKKLKRVKLTLTAVATDTAGNDSTKTLGVTLKK